MPSLPGILSSNSWKGFQPFCPFNVYEVLDVMLKSRADESTKAYVRVIESSWSGVKVDISTCSYLFLLVLFLYIYLKFSRLAPLVPR